MIGLIGRSLFVVGVVVLVTSLLACFRGEYLLEPAASRVTTRVALRLRAVIGYASLAAILGISATAFYILLSYVFPFTAAKLFQDIGVGVMVVVSLVVIVSGWKKGLPTLVTLLVLVMVWGFGYGLLLPQLLMSAQ
jgi:hypothetical protein